MNTLICMHALFIISAEWHYGYHHGKQNQQTEFKFWLKLFMFNLPHIFGKGANPFLPKINK